MNKSDQTLTEVDIESMLADPTKYNHDELLTNQVRLGNTAVVDKIMTRSTSVTPFVKKNIVREAIACNQLPMSTYLLRRDDFAKDLLLWDVTTETQNNILDYAIVLDKTDAALHIIAHHMDSVRQIEPSISVTLAVERNNRDILRALLQHSREPRFAKNYQDQINKALVTAAQRGFVGIVEEILLKNSVDPDVVHIGRAIQVATTHGHISTIEILAKAYEFALSDDQWELFRAACLSGQAQVVEWLLIQVKVRVEHLYLIDTFLSVVKSDKQPIDVVRVLLDHTDISFVTDVNPRKLLLFLKRHLRHEMFELLRAHLTHKGQDVRTIVLGDAWSKTDLSTILNAPQSYDHTKLLIALINAGDVEAIKQLLQVSSSVDPVANEYKALRKAIEFNSLDIAMLIVRHPAFKIKSFKFFAVIYNCLQKVKSTQNSNMVPRLALLQELVRELKVNVDKLINDLEAKYRDGMTSNLLYMLARNKEV